MNFFVLLQNSRSKTDRQTDGVINPSYIVAALLDMHFIMKIETILAIREKTNEKQN